MPIISERVDVGTTATEVVVPTYGDVGNPIVASILNLGPEDVDLGGVGVVHGEGYLLAVGATLDVDLADGDILYAVSDINNTTLCVLKLRQ